VVARALAVGAVQRVRVNAEYRSRGGEATGSINGQDLGETYDVWLASFKESFTEHERNC
jgi:hypothetical protein